MSHYLKALEVLLERIWALVEMRVVGFGPLVLPALRFLQAALANAVLKERHAKRQPLLPFGRGIAFGRRRVGPRRVPAGRIADQHRRAHGGIIDSELGCDRPTHRNAADVRTLDSYRLQ